MATGDQAESTGGGPRQWLVLLAVTMALAAVFATLGGQFATEEPAEPLFSLDTFELTDHHGRPFTNATLNGRLWVAAFVYTSCPGPCPAIIERLKKVESEAADLRELEFVVISVDPATDTPERLAGYADERGINAEEWFLVTGQPEHVWSLITEGFRLPVVSREDGMEPVPGVGPILHSDRLALVDGRSGVLGLYASGEEAERARLIADARGAAEFDSTQ